MKSNGIRKTVAGLFAAFAFSIVFMLFTRCWCTDEGMTWQKGSEDLVWGRILQMQQGEENPGGFLARYIPVGDYGYMEQAFLENATGQNGFYTHQSGLQGTIFGVVNKALYAMGISPQRRLSLLRFGNASMFVTCMVLICWWLFKKMRITAALLAFSCVLLAPFSQLSMSNLYWVTWTLALPFAVSAYLCDWIERRKKISVIALVTISATILLRCLCGFEFVSAVMIAVELPFVLEFLQADKANRRFWFQQMVLLGIMVLAAFGLALLIWMLQEYLYRGDWELVKQDMLMTVAKRTGAFQSSLEIDEIYAGSLQAGRWEVLWKYLTTPVYMQSITMLNMVIAAVVSLFPVCLLEKRMNNKMLLTRKQLRYLGMALVSVLAPASWYVLASAHSWIHTGINEILWLFPTIPLLLGSIGSNISVMEIMIEGKRYDLG